MKYDFDTPIDRSRSDSVKWAKGVFRYRGDGGGATGPRTSRMLRELVAKV